MRTTPRYPLPCGLHCIICAEEDTEVHPGKKRMLIGALFTLVVVSAALALPVSRPIGAQGKAAQVGMVIILVASVIQLVRALR